MCLYPANLPGASRIMINFDMKLGFPGFNELGDVDMCLTSFSRLFCEDQFLISPSLLEKHNALEVKKLISSPGNSYHAISSHMSHVPACY
jgi:hypothetical protein